MSEFVLQAGLLCFDGLDLSLSANQVSIDYAAEMQEITAIGHTSRRRLGGLKVPAIGASGFFDPSPDDENLFAALAVSDKVVIVSPGATEGDVAFAMKCLLGEYQPLAGSVGDVPGFDLSTGAQGPLVRSTLMHVGAETSSGAGTARNLGAVSAAQKLYAGVCVTSAAGSTPTLDLVVESDSADDFSGAETTRITFSQFSDIGSEWQSADGAITDGWFRMNWTLGGTSPDFTFVAVLGIQ